MKPILTLLPDHHRKAIESYGKFLSVCEKMGDPVIEGLAYNCLGVDCMLMACPPSEGSQFEGVRTVTPESQATLKRAIRYHQRHLDIADDGGQFVAHTVSQRERSEPPTNPPTDPPTDQPTNQPADQPTSQPASGLASRLANQLNNPPTRQPANQ